MSSSTYDAKPDDIRNGQAENSQKLTVLLTMRPWPGAWIRLGAQEIRQLPHGVSISDAEEAAALKIDTSGIDTVLMLLRCLLSYGHNRFPSALPETAIIDAAWANLGFNEILDLKLKRQLIIKIFDGQEPNRLDQDECTAWRIMQKLKNIFIDHDNFILCHRALTVTPNLITHGLYRAANRHYIEWSDGSQSVQETIDTYFKPTSTGQRLGNRPRFIHVICNRTTFDLDMNRSILLNSQTSSSRAGDAVTLGWQSEKYQLFAFVRMADKEKGWKDRIRVYGKQSGMDMCIPASLLLAHELEGSVRNPELWSEEDAGCFHLFYYHL